MTKRTKASTALRLGAWTAYASGVVAAIGLVFLIAMFVSFSVGSTSSGLVFGWINDVLVMVAYLLALPSAIALGALLRPITPVASGLATMIGSGAILAVVVLQAMLVLGTLTFEEQIGLVSIALLVLAVWFVMIGYLGSSSGVIPHGLRMGLLAATYIGYPVWAFWLGRHLLRLVLQPVEGPVVDAERRLATTDD